MKIRLAQSWDQPACADLYDRVTRHFFPEDLAFMDPIEDYYHYAAREEQYVAEIDGVIRGLLSIYWPEKFIHTLFVHPDFQRRKIGVTLLDHVGRLLPGAYELKVEKDNRAAQAFYQRQGWEQVEEGRGGAFDRAWYRYRKVYLSKKIQ